LSAELVSQTKRKKKDSVKNKTPTPKTKPSKAIITNKEAASPRHSVDPRAPKHVYTGQYSRTIRNVNGVMMIATREEIHDCEMDSRV